MAQATDTFPHAQIPLKVEQAIAEYLRAQTFTFNVSIGTGLDSSIIRGTHVDVVATRADREANGLGANWIVDAEIRITTKADDINRIDHNTYAGEIFNYITTSDFADRINSNTTGLTVFLAFPLTTEYNIDTARRLHISTLHERMICAGTSIA